MLPHNNLIETAQFCNIYVVEESNVLALFVGYWDSSQLQMVNGISYQPQ